MKVMFREDYGYAIKLVHFKPIADNRTEINNCFVVMEKEDMQELIKAGVVFKYCTFGSELGLPFGLTQEELKNLHDCVC